MGSGGRELKIERRERKFWQRHIFRFTIHNSKGGKSYGSKSRKGSKFQDR